MEKIKNSQKIKIADLEETNHNRAKTLVINEAINSIAAMVSDVGNRANALIEEASLEIKLILGSLEIAINTLRQIKEYKDSDDFDKAYGVSPDHLSSAQDVGIKGIWIDGIHPLQKELDQMKAAYQTLLINNTAITKNDNEFPEFVVTFDKVQNLIYLLNQVNIESPDNLVYKIADEINLWKGDKWIYTTPSSE